MDKDAKILSETYTQMHYKNVRLSDSQIETLKECVLCAYHNGEIGPSTAGDIIRTLDEA